MKEDKIRITIILDKEIVKLIDDDRQCKFVFLGRRSPMINQIIRKHYDLNSMFDKDERRL